MTWKSSALKASEQPLQELEMQAQPAVRQGGLAVVVVHIVLTDCARV